MDGGEPLKVHSLKSEALRTLSSLLPNEIKDIADRAVFVDWFDRRYVDHAVDMISRSVGLNTAQCAASTSGFGTCKVGDRGGDSGGGDGDNGGDMDVDESTTSSKVDNPMELAAAAQVAVEGITDLCSRDLAHLCGLKASSDKVDDDCDESYACSSAQSPASSSSTAILFDDLIFHRCKGSDERAREYAVESLPTLMEDRARLQVRI